MQRLAGLGLALFLMACGPYPSPGPVPPPTTTTTTTTTTTLIPAPTGCVNPTPGPVAFMDIKIHIPGQNWWWIDATPLVGQHASGTGALGSTATCRRDAGYCRLIGFDDGRGYCPARPEGHSDRGVCDMAVTSGGIFWTWNDQPITISGPPNPEARIDPVGKWMLQVKRGASGVARGCSNSWSGCLNDGNRMDCGQVTIP